MSITATVENDTIKLPIHVPNGTSVEIFLPGEPARPAVKSPAFAWMKKYAGCIKTLPADFAENHDAYRTGRKQR